MTLLGVICRCYSIDILRHLSHKENQYWSSTFIWIYVIRKSQSWNNINVQIFKAGHIFIAATKRYLWKQIMWSFSFSPNQCQNIFPCVFHCHWIPSILRVVCIFNMIVQFVLVIERRLKSGCAYYLIPFNINWMKYYLNKNTNCFVVK